MATTRASTTRVVRQPKPPTAAQRNTRATQGIVSALSATDAKAAVTAALEVVNEQLAWDTTLHQSLRQKYEELRMLANAKRMADSGSGPKPKPATGRATHSPLTKTNPYELADEFGRDHLRAVLEGASQKLLREAVDVVQARTMIKPASRTVKAAMIDYIVEHVAGPHY